MRDRGKRRALGLKKQRRREKLLHQLGEQPGVIYLKHIKKVNDSSGYMRDGNLGHYALTKPAKKTRDRNRYGAVLKLCKRDAVKRAEQEQQEDEWNLHQ